MDPFEPLSYPLLLLQRISNKVCWLITSLLLNRLFLTPLLSSGAGPPLRRPAPLPGLHVWPSASCVSPSGVLTLLPAQHRSSVPMPCTGPTAYAWMSLTFEALHHDSFISHYSHTNTLYLRKLVLYNIFCISVSKFVSEPFLTLQFPFKVQALSEVLWSAQTSLILFYIWSSRAIFKIIWVILLFGIYYVLAFIKHYVYLKIYKLKFWEAETLSYTSITYDTENITLNTQGAQYIFLLD